jgi:hypothetical protein
MIADPLRRAAAKLREHEGNLIAAPWTAEGDEVINDVSRVAEAYRPVHADYIALMHPPVALALAQMLERLAPLAPYWHEDYAAPFVPIIEQGMRVADAILREQP